MSGVMRMRIYIHLTIKVYNESIFLISKYGCEAWVLKKETTNKMQIYQSAQRTEVHDVNMLPEMEKAGHVAWHKKKWSRKLTIWRPWKERRNIDGLSKKWSEKISINKPRTELHGGIWKRPAFNGWKTAEKEKRKNSIMLSKSLKSRLKTNDIDTRSVWKGVNGPLRCKGKEILVVSKLYLL